MSVLTRAEALSRAELLTVHRYRIALDVAPDTEDFTSVTSIEFDCARPGAETFLDVAASEIESIELNGAPVDAGAVGQRVTLPGLARHNVVTVTARMRYSHDGEGLHRHLDPADGGRYLYAMSFLDAAPRWFACFDQPDLKARVELDVRTPPGWTVRGNGVARELEPGHWKISESRPIPTYGATVIAGPWVSVTQEHDGITLGVHARASLAPQLHAEAPEILSVTRACFDRYHELFGIRYPFGEYHQAFVPDFNAGAMENPGCVTFRDQYLFQGAATRGERGERAGTIAHEMAHMWFGDLVTMRWWDDLWLNESFAEYMGQRIATEATEFDAWPEFGIRRKDWGYIADQSPSTHPVAGNGAADTRVALAAFDGISYAKGASVLRQLALRLGDDVFFAGLRRYFDAHAHGNAEFADLIGAWTAAGADDLAGWAEAWLRTSGLDLIHVAIEADPLALAVVRESAPGSARQHRLQVGFFDEAGAELRRDEVLLDRPRLGLSGVPAGTALVLPDVGDGTWAKVRPWPRDWDAVGALLVRLEDPLARVVLYNAARDAVRDAELDPSQALDIMLAAVPGETNDLVRGDLLRFAVTTLAGPYSPVPDRPARLAAVTDVAGRLLTATRPDTVLVAARALLATTTSTEQLRGWLAEGRITPQLPLDPDLRWAALRRLAVLGAVTAEEIDAAAETEATSTARVRSRTALASLPDPTAKQRAWSLLTEPNELSGYELYAAAEGFFDPSQTEATASYALDFFDRVPQIAQFREGFLLARLTLLAFPSTHVREDVLQRAESLLASPGLHPGMRRSIVDATDALRRAHRSLAAFGSQGQA